MSDTPTLKVNTTILALVAVVVVLLVAITWILVGQGDGPADVATAPAQSDTAQAGSTGMPAGTAAAPPADFDPTTATQVPEDVSPDDFAATYYEAILVGDYETAYHMQPAHKQTGSVAEFQAQLEGYGITDYVALGHQDLGEQYIVGIDQITGSYGTFENQWTFVNVDGVWLVQDKAVTAMK